MAEKRSERVVVSRPDAALALLTEAVYRSRAKQSSAADALGVDLLAHVGPGSCGLGAKALVELELTEKGRAALDALFPNAAEEAVLVPLHGEITRWVERQDALDRKRNHFLRDFRRANGFERRAYTPAQQSAFQAGLEAINAEEDDARQAAARSVLELAERG